MMVRIQDAIQDARLRTIVHKYLVENGQEESYAFLFDKTTNKNAYLKYIREGAPKQVNIDDSLRRKMDELAQAGRWDEMGDDLGEARTEIVRLLNADPMRRFAVSDEYKGYLLSKDDSPASKLAVALKLKPKQSELAAGLLKVYNDARTPVDKYQAYEALVKLAGSEAKLNPALVKAGVPTPPPLRKGSPDGAQAVFLRRGRDLNDKVKATMLALLKKYNSASKRSDREKVLEDITKLAAKHTLNARETIDYMLKGGGWKK